MNRFNSTLRIVSRQSPLAWWQANYIKDIIQKRYPDQNIELIGLLTAGDKKSTMQSAIFSGKSLFVKELQTALINNEADIAVHSIKDLSVLPCPGLQLAAVSDREDPRDAFISNHYSSLQDLPAGAVVGTTSPRRQCQLLSKRPDILIKPLRGNVGTRINHLDNGHYDAIILACAGLKRLNLGNRIRQFLDPADFIPAIGQGALGIECREEDTQLKDLLSCVNDFVTHQCIKAERAVNFHLEGDCYTPIGAHATLQGDNLYLQALVGSLDGKIILKDRIQGPLAEAEYLGEQLAQKLIAAGAKQLIHP